MSIYGNHEHRGEDAFIKAQFEIARLKAQVERLKAEPDALTAYLYADTLRRDDIKTLKAHIERLTKAGDAMREALLCSGCSECMGMYDCHDDGMKAWEAAKKGGQP